MKTCVPNGLLRMVDGDRRVEQRAEILPHVDLLFLAADEDRNRPLGRGVSGFNKRGRLGRRCRRGIRRRIERHRRRGRGAAQLFGRRRGRSRRCFGKPSAATPGPQLRLRRRDGCRVLLLVAGLRGGVRCGGRGRRRSFSLRRARRHRSVWCRRRSARPSSVPASPERVRQRPALRVSERRRHRSS